MNEQNTQSSSDLPTFDQYVDDCRIMLRFLRGSHLNYDSKAAETIIQIEEEAGPRPTSTEVIEAHQKLLRSIEPATPKTLRHHFRYRDKEKHPRFTEPFMIRLMWLTLLILILFILLSLDPEVTGIVVVAEQNGKVLFLNELYLAFAAGLGAIFSVLFKADQFVSKAAFDPSRSVSYYVRIQLGIVAGLMLSILLYGQLEVADESANQGRAALGQAVLAMLGGFSASAVYEIIERFVDTLRAAIRGSGKEVARAEYARKLVAQEISNSEKVTALQQQHNAATQQIANLLLQVQDHGAVPKTIGDVVSEIGSGKLKTG